MTKTLSKDLPRSLSSTTLQYASKTFFFVAPYSLLEIGSSASKSKTGVSLFALFSEGRYVP
jgi:hypothetical protein